MNLQPTTIYKVTVKTANSIQAVLRLTFKPSVELILHTLLALKAQDVSPNQATPNDEYNTRWSRRQKHLDDLMELVNLASIRIPTPDNNSTSEIKVAGVHVGSINIHASEAWEIQ